MNVWFVVEIVYIVAMIVMAAALVMSNKENNGELDWQTYCLMVALSIFWPLTLIGLVTALKIIFMQDKGNKILYRWTKKAELTVGSTKEQAQEMLVDEVKRLSKKELLYLSRINEWKLKNLNALGVAKIVFDELVERELMDDTK